MHISVYLFYIKYFYKLISCRILPPNQSYWIISHILGRYVRKLDPFKTACHYSFMLKYMLHTSTFNSTSIKKFCYFLKTTLKTLFRDYLLNIVLSLDAESFSAH
jgi:hypothetical protein